MLSTRFDGLRPETEQNRLDGVELEGEFRPRFPFSAVALVDDVTDGRGELDDDTR
jgi:hypothetical protein